MKTFITLLLAASLTVGGSIMAGASTDEKDINMSVRKHYGPEGVEQPGDNAQAEKGKADKKDKKDKKKGKRGKRPDSMDEAEYAAMAARKAKEDSIREAERRELEELLNADYTIKPMTVERIPYSWHNDTVLTSIDELLPLFNVRDLPSGEKMYIYNGLSMHFKENTVFMYFTVKDGVVQPLRFHVSFYADSPLDFTHLEFLLDGFNYSYTPDKIEKGKDGGRFYFENFDEPVNDRSKDILYALSHCEWCHMTFVSSIGVNHRIHFDEIQLKHFRQTYELFRLMGGEL